MISIVRFDRSGTFSRDQVTRAMTPREITNGLRKRKYQWGKTTTELAAEVGVSVETINAGLLGKPLSEYSVAKIVTYLQTARGPSALVRDHGKNAKPRSDRIKLVGRIVALAMLARQYGVHSRKRDRLKELTTGKLRAYYWNLDSRLKEELIKRSAGALAGKRYLFPDSQSAWEWIERIEKLKAHGQANPSRN